MIIFRGRRRYVFLGALVSALALISDQAAKFAVLSGFREMSEIIEVTGFLNLVLSLNRGVSFGMFSGDSRWNTVFLIILALGIVAFADMVVPYRAAGLGGRPWIGDWRRLRQRHRSVFSWRRR